MRNSAFRSRRILSNLFEPVRRRKAGCNPASVTATFLLVVGMCSCNGRNDGSSSQDTSAQTSDLPVSTSNHADTLLVITMPDDALWGHLGEGTGMSVLEFITDAGDTLYIYKESEFTGQEGSILGSIRNYTDRFCITTADSGQTLVKAVNVTQLQELWSDAAHRERDSK